MAHGRDDDIDAAFRDLVAGVEDGLDTSALEGEDLPVGGSDTSDEAGAGAASAASPDGPARSADDTPVDEALHLEGGRLQVALVLAPIPSAEGLHALLSLAGIHECVVRLKPWTAVWMAVETEPTPEDEWAALLEGRRSMPPEVDAVARAVSRLSKYGAVAVISWLVEGDGIDLEPGVSGQISARRYVGGEPEEDVPAGLLLGSMPPATEDLLLGRTRPEDYEDSVTADGTTRRRPGPFGWLRRK